MAAPDPRRNPALVLLAVIAVAVLVMPLLLASAGAFEPNYVGLVVLEILLLGLMVIVSRK